MKIYSTDVETKQYFLAKYFECRFCYKLQIRAEASCTPQQLFESNIIPDL